MCLKSNEEVKLILKKSWSPNRVFESKIMERPVWTTKVLFHINIGAMFCNYTKKKLIACRPGTPMLLENGPYIFREASRSASEICCQWNEEADGI